MLANFFNSNELKKEFDIYFSYRYSREYHYGLEKRINSEIKRFPVNFIDLSNPELLGNVLPFFVRRVLMIFLRIIFNVPLIIYEIIRLIVLIRTINPDIVHINSGGFPPSLSTKAMIISSKLIRVKKIILVINNSPEKYFSFRRIINLPMDLLINLSVNKIITGSKYNAKRMRELCTINKNKVLSIPNGIKKRKIINTKKEVLKKIGIPDFNGQIFLTVAILVPRKGHKILVDAVKILNDEIKDFSKNSLFIIEGKGSSEDEIKKQIKDSNLNENFKFLKDYENIFDLMNIADVILLTSIANEDFPNVVIEGMSLEKLVLASRIAGVPEQIIDMESGLTFNIGDKTDLVRKLKIILSGKINLDNIRKNALTRYHQLFSVERSVMEYIYLYRS